MTKVGTYYKYRSKQFFLKNGFKAEYLERAHRFITPDGKVMFSKSDVFGADILAMDGKQMIFANSKVGRKNIAQGIKEFMKHPYPPGVIRWVLVWEKGASEPEIVDLREVQDEDNRVAK